MATLRIGTLDLSRYLNVQQGDGMDPANPTFSDRMFSHSLLREGGVYALEDIKLKELVFPVFLTAATKDGLHALVQQINLALAVQPQTATWQDDNATSATTFDLATGQLDLEYDYRRAQNNYLHAKLRLFAQPFGRTATPRLIANATGLGPVITFSTPSPVLGDVPANVVATIYHDFGDSTPSEPAVTLAFSVLSGPSYCPQFTASLFTAPDRGTTATILFDSLAVASTFRRMAVSSQAQASWFRVANVVLAGTAHQGDNRVLAITRPVGPSQFQGTSFPSLPLWISDGNGNANAMVSTLGAALFVPTQWRMYDMGVVTVDPSRNAFPAISLWTTKHPVASYAIDVAALIILPEDSTVFISDPYLWLSQQPQYGASDPVNENYFLNAASAVAHRYPQNNPTQSQDVTMYTRGVIPRVAPAASGAYLAVLGWAGSGNVDTRAAVSLVERTRYVF